MFSCKKENRDKIQINNISQQYEWYKNTKNEIIKQSNIKHDRICIWEYGEGVFKDSFFINNNRVVKIKVYKNGKLYLDKVFNKNNLFELRIKYYPNGYKQTEGILYYGSYIGLYKSWYENGQLHEFGLQYTSNFVSNYKTWTRKGECKTIIEKKDTTIQMPNIFN